MTSHPYTKKRQYVDEEEIITVYSLKRAHMHYYNTGPAARPRTLRPTYFSTV